MKFRNFLLLAAITFGVSLLPAPAFAAPRTLTEVSLPLEANERIEYLEFLGTAGDHLISYVTISGGARGKVSALVGANGSNATILLDVTESLSDTTIPPNGGITGKWVSFVKIDSGFAVIKGDEAQRTTLLWVTDGTLAGTRQVDTSGYLGFPVAGLIRTGFAQYILGSYGLNLIGSKLLFSRSSGVGMAGYEIQAVDLQSGASEVLLPSAGNYFEIRKIGGQSRYLILTQQASDSLDYLWSTDGTAAGATLLLGGQSTNGWGTFSRVSPSLGADGASLQTFKVRPFVTDGTPGGSFVLDTSLFTGVEIPSYLQLGDKIIYKFRNQDGQAIGALNLHTLQIEKLATLPTGALEFGDYSSEDLTRYVTGRTAVLPHRLGDLVTDSVQLWRTDGTVEGTFPLSEQGVPVSIQFSLNNNSPAGVQYFSDLVTDGTNENTYRLTGAGYSSAIAATAEGRITASIGDYLGRLFSSADPKDAEKSARSMSINVHVPEVSRELATVLLPLPANVRNSIGANAIAVVSAAESQNRYYFGYAIQSDQYRYGLLSIEKDLCPDSDAKLTPGLCGCGVGESEFRFDLLGIVAPRAAVCLTDEGPVLIDPDSVPNPTTSTARQIGAQTEFSLSFAEDILSRITAQFDLAQISTGQQYQTFANESVKRNASVKHSVRVVRVRGFASQQVMVRSQGRGKFLVRVRGQVRRSDKLGFEYGIQASDKGSGKLLFQSAGLKRAALRVNKLKAR